MRPAWFVVLCACTVSPVLAQHDSADLATKLSNPISDLISVPFQFNGDCCFGPEDGGRFTLNIQPVIPFPITSDWSLIVRTILPVIDQQETVPGGGNAFGLSDTTQSFFFSPASAPGGIFLGAGPAFLWPTGTDNALDSGKWGVGPTLVVLKQESGWTYGVLTNHIWSYAGETDRPDVSNTFIQPFIGYTWPDSTGLTLNSESTYAWIARQWTVPINLELSHVFKFGSQPVSLQLGARYYPVSPEFGPTWGVRFNVVFLFPD